MMAMLALKRRRELKTDYKNRLALLKSSKHRAVIRRSLNGVRIQAVEFMGSSDKTSVEVFSKMLLKYGWKGHLGNIPAAYLTGFLFGKLCLKAGVKECNVDIGLNRAVKGSRIFAAVKGCKDAGVGINVAEEILPDDNRTKGVHIAEYAKKMKSESQDKFRKHFAAYIKAGSDPENLPGIFNQTKEKISEVLR